MALGLLKSLSNLKQEKLFVVNENILVNARIEILKIILKLSVNNHLL